MDNINTLTRIIRGILRLRGRLRTRRGGAALRIRDSLSRRACSENSNVLAKSSKRKNNITGEFKVESEQNITNVDYPSVFGTRVLGGLVPRSGGVGQFLVGSLLGELS